MTTAPVRTAEDIELDTDKMLFGDLLQSIGYAETWRELDGWLARASRAAREGAIGRRQLEVLVERAIAISRTIPEH